MLRVLRNRNFALVWAGGLVTQIGDWALFIALPMYVYRLTGSTLATSGAFVSEIVPSMLLGPFAGVFVDRWDRRKIIIVANVLLAVGLLPLLAVHSSNCVWIVYVVALGQAVISQFLYPAWNALLPLLVPAEDLVSANSLRSLNASVARLVGPAVGGLAVAAGSLAAGALIDSGSFLFVAVMATFVSGVTLVKKERADGAGALRAFLSELGDGLALLRENRVVATLVASNTIVSVGEGVFSVMFVVWVRQVLHGGSLQLGWFMSAQAIGGVLGGLAVAHLGRRLPPVPVLGICTIAFGALDMTLFTYPVFLQTIGPGLIIIAVVGLPGAATGATWNALLQLSTDDARRGRIFGLIGASSNASALIGTILAGTLGGVLGPIFLLNATQGVVYIIAGAMVLVVLRQMWVRPAQQVLEGQASS